jgi:hypothetical protein
MVNFIGCADMYGEHFSENSGLCGHRAHRHAPDHRVLPESEEQPGHPLRAACDLAVPPLVVGQIARFDCIGQRRGLTERQAEPFAGDGVH